MFVVTGRQWDIQGLSFGIWVILKRPLFWPPHNPVIMEQIV